jgi:phosphonate degradation associated HDIG domain protein
MPQVDQILELYEQRGGSLYGGEAVTQLEHALQSAWLAEQEQSSPQLIVAALVHDVGHLLHELPDDAPDAGVDDHHERSAANWLRALFPPSVTEPVRLHVAAKRYLCTVEPGYLAALSEPSLVSYRLQGGPMPPDEVRVFEQNPHSADAVRLRRWDDTAKVPKLPTPPLAHFAPLLHQVAVRNPPA